MSELNAEIGKQGKKRTANEYTKTRVKRDQEEQDEKTAYKL
jgi:hypothetical protein